MVDSTSRRRFLAASGTTAIGLGAGFGFASGTAGAQQDPAPGFERVIQWGGMGSENATQACPGELGFWKWNLTRGGPTAIQEAQLTVVFSDGETLTVPGFFPGGGEGAIQFEVTRPGDGTIVSAFADFTGGGDNPVLTISEGECIEDPDQIPEITAMTDVATDVNGGGATLNGTLMTVGEPFPVEVFFQYRVAGDAIWITTGATTLTAPGPFSVRIEGLNLDTTYEYRAVAVAADGTTSTGAIMQFTKSAEPVMDPVVFTGPATEINESTATLNGELVELGDFSPVTVFFEYRIVGSDGWLETAPQPFTASGPFSAEIDVEPGNDYEYRAVAVADGVRIEGLTQTFTKPLIPPEEELPTVGTEPATEVNEATATANGVLVDPGTFTAVEVFFEYRLVGTDPWITTPPQTLTAPGPFSAEIPGLTEGLEYEYRAVAVANDSVVVGPIQRFAKVEPPIDPPVEPPVEPPEPPEPPIQPPIEPPFEPPVTPPFEPPEPIPIEPPIVVDLPTVDTDPATDVNEFSATLNATVTDLGQFPVVAAGFEYRAVGTDTWLTTDTVALEAPGPISQQVTNLEQGVQYEFRPVLVTEATTIRGDLETFVKEAPDMVLPAVTTDPATDVNESSATLNATLETLGDFPAVDVSFQYRVAGTDTWLETGPLTRTEPGAFAAEIDGLAFGLRYEFRAVLEADSLTIVGAIESFTKGLPEPITVPDPVPTPVPEPKPVVIPAPVRVRKPSKRTKKERPRRKK